MIEKPTSLKRCFKSIKFKVLKELKMHLNYIWIYKWKNGTANIIETYSYDK